MSTREFIFSGEQDFEVMWDKFAKDNNNVSWRYLSKSREYQRIYCGSVLLKDLSFIILNDNMPISICPLFLEQYNENKQFSYASGYQTAPLIKNDLHAKHRKKIERKCFEKIDELSCEYNVSKVMLMLDPLAEKYDYNILTEYGYLDSSISTAIVDLSLDKKDLWSNLRRRYKSQINNGKDKFNIHIIDYQNPDFETHEIYRKLHHKTAGRITRPIKTFDLQFDMLKEDNAVLIGLQDRDKFVAFSYFIHHNKCAYYGSASDDPDYISDTPLEHYIIWTAIGYYKKRNFNFLELGWQQFGPQVFDHPNQKDINISFFKRGFGGKILVLYRGLKYYDKEYMKKDLEDNIQKLISVM